MTRCHDRISVGHKKHAGCCIFRSEKQSVDQRNNNVYYTTIFERTSRQIRQDLRRVLVSERVGRGIERAGMLIVPRRSTEQLRLITLEVILLVKYSPDSISHNVLTFSSTLFSPSFMD